MDVLTYSWFIDNVKVVATDTINGPIGIAESMLDDRISLYPNPVKDRLHVESKARIHSASITTSTGVILGSKIVSDTQMDWPLEGYSKGVYVLHLVTDDGVITKKIVVGYHN